MAGLAAVAGALAGAGDERSAGEAASSRPAECQGSDGPALRALAGQRLVVRSDGTPDSQLLARARRGAIAGVVLFPGEGDADADVRRGLRRLQQAAKAGGAPPLLVTTDQEGGLVKRFPEGPPLRTPNELALDGDEGDSRLEGRATGHFLAAIGVNVDLAPVLDVPASGDSVIGFRSFGDDPQEVARLGLAFADGLAKEGVLATAKHFPGLGRSVLNTDLSRSEIAATRRELAADLHPFEAAIARSVPLVMVGLASYPRIGANGPAALERAVATRLLRTQLGFEGVSISDDLGAEAVASSLGETEAAERAAGAGIDLLLFARSSAPGVTKRLARGLRTGALPLDDASESCARVVALRESLDGAAPPASP